MRSSISRAALILGVSGLAQVSMAQWSVTLLHPAGFHDSIGSGIDQTGQVGTSTNNSFIEIAGIWSGSAGSWVSLHPASSSVLASKANAISGGVQAGSVIFNSGYTHASMWLGSASSWIDLSPAPNASSEALGVGGTQQVGYAVVNFTNHASLWAGSAASWVDLAPAGATDSMAYAVSDGQQVGYVHIASIRASLWTGSAASWVDLSPANSSESYARAVSGGVQVGYADHFPDGQFHAGLWRGSAASWIDLHPAAVSSSAAFGVFGDFQVGQTRVNNFRSAALWQGCADSWVNLGEMLPGQWGESVANGVWHDSTTLYVIGFAYSQSRGRVESVLWSSPLPGQNLCADVNPCEPDVNQDGVADQGDVDYLINVVAGGENPTQIDPDINRDGVADQGDVDALINVIAGGSCP